MITVEGLDNTGKTTLVKKLCSDFPQLKFTPSIGNKHDLNQIVEQAWYIAEEAEVDEIWDRSRIISEYVYNPVLNKRSLAFGHATMLKMMREWLQRPQLIIYCTRPLPNIQASFDEREQLDGVVSKLKELAAAYEAFMGFLAIMFKVTDPPKYLLEYNFEEDKYEYIRDLVGRYLVEAKNLAEARG